MNRRSFILNTSLALAAGPAALAKAAEPVRKAVVAIARNPKAVRDGNRLDDRIIREMVDAAVAAAAGETRPRDAWKKLFRPTDRVGIKINTLSGPMMSSHPQVAGAIAAALRDAGLKPADIFVWDRLSDEMTRAGYTVRAKNVREYTCIATDGRYSRNPDDILEHGEIGSFLSPIVTRLCTALISVPILKDHDLAGVTCGMKNFFGAIHNPNKYHFDNKHEAIADLSGSPPIRRRMRLTICDATRVSYEAGPGYKPQFTERPGMILASCDPVALDYAGWRQIEELRKAHGRKTLAQAGREPQFIARAAATGLGTNDPKKITITTI